MLLPRQHLAGAIVESSGLVAGVVVALLMATGLFVGRQTGWDGTSEFKAAALFIAVGMTHVIIARLMIERRLVREVRASFGNETIQRTVSEFAGAWSRSIGIGLGVAGVAAYFMLTQEMGWGILNTNWGVALVTGIIASTATKWSMVCSPSFMLVRGTVWVPNLGEPDDES